MQLLISPSLRHIKVFPGKGVGNFIKVKVGSHRVLYRTVFYSLLFLTFLLRFIFMLTAMDTIQRETSCSSIGRVGKRLGPIIWGRRAFKSTKLPEIYQILEEGESGQVEGGAQVPQSLQEFVAEMRSNRSDATTVNYQNCNPSKDV